MRKEEVLTKEELKFLTTAPAKAKAVMYFDHLANVTTGGEPLFEPEELAIVIDSLLQTEKGNKIYKKFLAIDPKAKYALQTLLQARLSYREQLAIIDGLVALKKQAKTTEKLINEIFTIITDNEQRSKLTLILTKPLPRKTDSFWIMRNNPGTNPDVRIDIMYTVKENGEDKQPIGIDEKIRQHKAKAEADLIYFKTFLKAVKDSMRASGFMIPRYLELYSTIEGDMKERSKEAPLPDVYPDYKTAEIDEDKYKYFREKVI